jgi:hypothetical protein
MKAFSTRFICNLVILSTIILPYSAHTQAALIGTEQAIANVQAQRDKVSGFVARADVQKQFAALGMDPAVAGERVNALTDDEVQQIAGKIDSLPVGADAGGLVITVLLIVVLVILIMYLLDNKRWR